MSALHLHVHRWDPATAPDQPTILLLHGTGGDENDLMPFGRMLAPGAALLGVRGNVSENGARRFFRRLAEGVFDLEDLHRRTGELGDFLESAAAAYDFSTSSLFALGYSNGANVAASLLLERPAALAGGALFRAMVPFEPATTPALAGKKVLISAGRFDAMIPPAGSERLAAILREGGADVELVWQPTSHGLTQGDVTTGHQFFAALTRS
ncbi:MAG: alpha/beta hydrolase [Polaromonas sp.]|nr:alpha/beta hydrolase [Gemmatimonadaceae bacterium]